MSGSVLISIVIIVLAIAFLPAWKHSRLWGGGYSPSVFMCLMLLAHGYTVLL